MKKVYQFDRRLSHRQSLMLSSGFEMVIKRANHLTSSAASLTTRCGTMTPGDGTDPLTAFTRLVTILTCSLSIRD